MPNTWGERTLSRATHNVEYRHVSLHIQAQIKRLMVAYENEPNTNEYRTKIATDINEFLCENMVHGLRLPPLPVGYDPFHLRTIFSLPDGNSTIDITYSHLTNRFIVHLDGMEIGAVGAFEYAND